MDFLNYSVFIVVFIMRLKTLKLIPGIGLAFEVEDQLEAIQERVAQAHPTHHDKLEARYSEYVNFVNLALWYGRQYTLSSFNAILTWYAALMYPSSSLFKTTLLACGNH